MLCVVTMNWVGTITKTIIKHQHHTTNLNLNFATLFSMKDGETNTNEMTNNKQTQTMTKYKDTTTTTLYHPATRRMTKCNMYGNGQIQYFVRPSFTSM